MRRWADAYARLQRIPADELASWRARSNSDLSPDQRDLLASDKKLRGAPDDGIKGSLRDDRLVELDGGRHRAAYLMERGIDPLPVWVTAPGERQLDRFEADCNRESLRGNRGSRPMREEDSDRARA